ncbi:Uu.00g003200.m01.CDS01 [Anthostomella pinea]|uniref:Uu.00g003200.m01.CDS01 n=1 Tax=Anthostomella pinea TaxID=933095 RepID=A0AAI8VKV2_9PEZI|nr:Uu.00g003200.m01.CDS01 [Anthostomella pinea]
MVEYSTEDFHNCLGGQKVVLAGDSTIRQIFWAAARKLDPVKADVGWNEASATHEKYQDLSFEAEGVRLEFIWDPWLNSTTLDDALKTFRATPGTPDQKDLRKKDEVSAALMLLGSPGLWAARYGGDDYMSLFKRGISAISTYLPSASDEETLSTPPDASNHFDPAASQILLTPVQNPRYSTLSPSLSESITPERVVKMNDYLAHLPANQTSHVVWAFNRMTDDSEDPFESDGLHVEDSIAERKIDIVLNSHCNNPAVSHDRAFKGTCCVAEPHNTLYDLALVLVLALTMYLPRSTTASKLMRRLPISPEIGAATRDLLNVLIWCWICDGTLQLSKSQRHYQQGPFIVLCLFWLAGSFSVLSKIMDPAAEAPWSTAKKGKPDPLTNYDQRFMCRDQSDEIKGLMQGLILLSNYNDASQSLWVYKIVRVLVSAYFFLSAYGHTLYILKTGDYSFRRVAVVLFRTNLLTAILPYMMGTSYSTYYFVPVVTFWYLVLYAMLFPFKRSNQDPWPLAMKVLATASFVSVFITTPGYLEATTDLLYRVFRMSLDSQEMRFRLRLDRYIVFVGVMVASLTHSAGVNDAQEIFTAKGSPRAADHGRTRFYVFCSVSLGLFFYVTQMNWNTKADYNAIHPYISWAPILTFITLRNLHPPARKAYLALPAMLGRISLETYVVQHHIWLGGDATTKLTLGFDSVYGAFFEKAVLSILFIGVAALTHRATRVYANWLSEVGLLVFGVALWTGSMVYG